MVDSEIVLVRFNGIAKLSDTTNPIVPVKVVDLKYLLVQSEKMIAMNGIASSGGPAMHSRELLSLGFLERSQFGSWMTTCLN